ncbi:MAG TPA: hypothetical protein VGN72_02140 [Tepidisphaeraceae bacterium]|jgi:hypothetical protein|nr:hypothetical protein [Tepidisphaeraceae bacterium]
MADLERVNIKLVADDGSALEGVFELDHESEACVLTLDFARERLRAEASDYFEALADIRGQLAQRKLRPVCYGASRNVFPSGMARDMGAGLKAYRLTLGKPARMKDLVGILDVGPDVDPVPVEEQRTFFERWLESASTDQG